MKTLEERLADYIRKHPEFDIDTVYDRVQDMHKRAIYKLQSRISNRIENMMTGTIPVFFLTFTFSDEFLPSGHEERLSKSKIEAFMRTSGVIAYVANIDYGKKRGRFHWHAVAQSYDDFDHNLWKYGAINFKRIPFTSKSIQLSRYLIKLKNHAIKVVDPLILYYPRYYK